MRAAWGYCKTLVNVEHDRATCCRISLILYNALHHYLCRVVKIRMYCPPFLMNCPTIPVHQSHSFFLLCVYFFFIIFLFIFSFESNGEKKMARGRKKKKNVFAEFQGRKIFFIKVFLLEGGKVCWCLFIFF